MESWTAGPHLFEFEPPDIFHCHVRATIDEAEARESVRISIDELGGKRGIQVFFMAHLEASGVGGTFTSAAKKYLGERKPEWKAILIVGGNPVVRLAASIMARAQSVLSSERKMPTVMVGSMDEARQVLAELRAKDAARTARVAKG